jgi:hypothetical protein
MDLKTRYVIKGINKEQTINSKINIFTTADGSKIEKVEDKWDGQLPDSAIKDVSSVFQLLNPVWWFNYWLGWTFWLWSFVWYTRVWLVSPRVRMDAMLTLISCAGLPKAQQRYRSVPRIGAEEC